MVPTDIAPPYARGGEDNTAYIADSGRHPYSWLRPGWPITVIYLGFPLWWVTGATVLVFPLMAVPMLIHLLQLPKVRVPKGFALWILFLVWMLASCATLQTDAPGAISGSSNSRYLTFLFRAVLYFSGTIMLLYVGNLSEADLPRRRVARLLGFMFIVVTCGGLLGVFLPHLQFPSLLEIILPGRIANIDFVNSLIHPVTAQVQDVLGYSAPRPSAPFNYTNTWAANLNCYLPFFLIAWGGIESGWRRRLVPVVLAAALVPVIVSLDRGLWIGLGVALAYAVIRLAMIGRTGLLTVLVASVAIIVVVILASPLGHIIQLRLQHPHSNEGRANLSGLTLSSAWKGSPIVGFGTTRDVQGNFNTIAGGSGPGCVNCEPPAMGTQGDIWRVVFSYGFVGAGLYLAFFARQFGRYVRRTDPYAIAGCCVLVVSAFLMFVYDSLGAQYFTIMLAIALMWREDITEPRDSEDRDLPVLAR